MKTKITFKALRRGKVVYKKIPIEHNFKKLPEEVFMGYSFPGQSVESQVIEYLDNIDKSEIMVKHDFDIILDYFIPKKKMSMTEEINSFVEYIKPLITPENQRQYQAIISEAKDILFGKGKSNKTKAIEVTKMLSMSYKAISGTLSSVIKLFNTDEENKLIGNGE